MPQNYSNIDIFNCDCGGRLIKMILLDDINTSEIYSGVSVTQSLITVCSHDQQEHFTVEKDYSYIITCSGEL